MKVLRHCSRQKKYTIVKVFSDSSVEKEAEVEAGGEVKKGALPRSRLNLVRIVEVPRL